MEKIKLNSIYPQSQISRKNQIDYNSDQRKNNNRPKPKQKKKIIVTLEMAQELIEKFNNLSYFKLKNIKFKLLQVDDEYFIISQKEDQLIHKMTFIEALEHFEHIENLDSSHISGSIIDIRT